MSRAAKFKRLAAANPVARAIERAHQQEQAKRNKAQFMAEIGQLRFLAELQAWGGNTTPDLINVAARLVWVVLGAAAGTPLQDSPDVRIIRGAGEALGDLAQDQDLERHRASIQAGLMAIERIVNELDLHRMAVASVELERLLDEHGSMGTEDLRRLIEHPPQKTTKDQIAVTI